MTIGHLLSTRQKHWLFRLLQPQRRIDVAILHARSQRRVALKRLGFEASQLALLPYQVDSEFWRSRTLPSEPLICSAGLEYRDYAVLLQAVAGLPVQTIIAASSRWSHHASALQHAQLPANVEVTAMDYPALRRLYERAQFVVIPLRQVANQAGITTVLEAMSMGRAVIVTATAGQRDVVRGRLCSAQGFIGVIGGPAAFGLDDTDSELGAETGLYVLPGDSAGLRFAIRYLLDHPDEAGAMGRAGRRLVERHLSLDKFAMRVRALLTDTSAGADGEPSLSISHTSRTRSATVASTFGDR